MQREHAVPVVAELKILSDEVAQTADFRRSSTYGNGRSTWMSATYDPNETRLSYEGGPRRRPALSPRLAWLGPRGRNHHLPIVVRATCDQDQQAPVPVAAPETWLPEPRALQRRCEGVRPWPGPALLVRLTYPTPPRIVWQTHPIELGIEPVAWSRGKGHLGASGLAWSQPVSSVPHIHVGQVPQVI